MRINLADEGRERRKRRGRRRTRTFDESITLPRLSPRKKRGRRRASTRRGRARRRQQASLQGAATPPPALKRVPWRAVLARSPLVLLLAALVGGIVYGSVDRQFFVYQAQIMGARRLEAEVIYQAAGVHEQNIFWIQPQAVARRIRQLDGIRAVRVRCDLPAQVTIEVEEREPVVLWRVLAQERDWWLDEEGVVLPYHGDANAPDVIFVVDGSERRLQVGDRIEPEGLARSVQQLAAALPGVRVFFYQADRGLSFTQRVEGGEWPVYVGAAEDLARKIQVVQALTDYIVQYGIRPRYVDVRWPDHPVYGRPEGAQAREGE